MISTLSIAQHTFIEKDGEVSIEAEHYTSNFGPWEQVEGRNTILDVHRGFGTELMKLIKFTQEGTKITGLSSLPLTDNGKSLPWATPNKNATIIALSPENRKHAVVFLFEKGQQMEQASATDKRAAFLCANEQIVPESKKIFDGLLKWAVPSPQGKKALFISREKMTEGDLFLKNRLTAAGFEVQPSSGTDDISNANLSSYGLIVLSESSSAEHIKDKYKLAPTPVIVCKSALLGPMNMIVQEKSWEPIQDQFGNAILNRNGKKNDFLKYSIYFTKAGPYKLWLLGKSSGQETERIYLSFSKKNVSDGGSNFDNLLSVDLKDSLQWVTNGSKITVDAKGWYHFYVVIKDDRQAVKSMYPGWRIDKIVLSNNEKAPKGDHTAESLNVNVTVDFAFFAPKEYVPSQVWMEKDGYIIVEAESIDHHSHWKEKTSPEGFTGKSYLNWEGPNRTVSIEKLGGNDDYINVRQGPQEEWLILRVWITNPGEYRVDARNYHQLEDGDNDAWVSKIGFNPTPKNPIKRMGDSKKDCDCFSWLDWGVHKFKLQKGLNEIYIGGRSVGFGIDRIALYREKDESAKASALNLRNGESKLKNHTNHAE